MVPSLISVLVLMSVLVYMLFRIREMLAERSEYSTWEKILYAPAYTIARLLWRVRIMDAKKITDFTSGGAIVVANHRCSLDPFFVQLAAGRRVHWMVASEYFKHPLFGKALRLFQAIPTTRSGNDSSATKQAIRLASEGRLVGMFPEGRLNRTRMPIQSIRAGALLVAKKANVPIVPLWLRGSPIGADVWVPLIMTAQVTVKVGPVTHLPEDILTRTRNEQTQWLQEVLMDNKFGD